MPHHFPVISTKQRDLWVACPDRWDEACWLLPAVRALLASNLSVGVLCQVDQAELWSSLGGLVVIPITPKDKPRHVAKRMAGLWKASLVWETGTAAEIAVLAKTPRRLGPAGKRLEKFLTHPLSNEPPAPGQHRVRHYLSAIEEMGIPTRKPEFFAPIYNVDPACHEPLLLVPDSDFGPSHEWPLEFWKTTALQLQERGHVIHISHTKTGRGIGGKLLASPDLQATPWEIPNFSEILPRLAEFQRVLATDGSIPHLAALAGANCATWFGPNDPAWHRPLGKNHLVLARHAECSPCLSSKCLLDFRCHLEMPPEWIWPRLEFWLTTPLAPYKGPRNEVSQIS